MTPSVHIGRSHIGGTWLLYTVKKAFLFKLAIRKFQYRGLKIPLLIPGHFPATQRSFSHSPVSENSSGPWKETFCIPKCRKSLPVPGVRHFTFLHAIKVWLLEGVLAWLQGPEFSGIGECKRSNSGKKHLQQHGCRQHHGVGQNHVRQ